MRAVRTSALWVATSLLLASARSAAEEPAPNVASQRFRITCDYPIVDAPFNLGGWGHRELEWPSMAQSLSLTKCVYQLGHKGIQAGISSFAEAPIWQKLGVAVFDLAMPGRPLGSAWLHEEWHRSVMSVRGIDSYNEVYDFELFGGTIRVSHVTDADLANLKRDHNPDLVRLAAAGVESSYELNLALEKDEFFRGTTVYNRVLLWLDYLAGAGYVASSLIDTPDQFEREAESERSEQEKDFVGHDVTGWAYDLFRPDEPYAARGVHPAGAGVERYIGRADLPPGARRYLALQSGLSLLNFVDPFLFGQTYFEASIGGREVRWNATLRHHLTSFGSAIDVNVFSKSSFAGNLFLVLHSYYNAERPYFGLEAQILDHAVARVLFVSTRAMLWQQPRDHVFRTTSGTFGGLVSTKAAVRIAPWFRQYLEVEAKSDGWVAGNPYLDAALSTRVGVESTF